MIPSARLLLPFTIVMVIALYHVTSVQSVAVSGMESTLDKKRSTGNGKMVEDVKRKLIAALLKKRHEKKTHPCKDDGDDDDDDDDDDDESGSGMKSALHSEWIAGMKAISKKFQAVAKATKRRQQQQQQQQQQQLRDRDYFEAIGLTG